MGRKFSAEEIDYLRRYYNKKSCSELGRALGRSSRVIRHKLKLMGLQPSRVLKPWSKQEVAYLREHAGEPVARLASCLGRSETAVATKLSRLGISNRLSRFKDFTLSLPDAAYLAGIIDGEGTLTCSVAWPKSKQLPKITALCFISNTNEELIGYLKDLIPSSHIVVDSPRSKATRRIRWKIIFGEPILSKVLSEILPYLIVKKEHARLILEFSEIRREHWHKGAITARQIEIVLALRRLNLHNPANYKRAFRTMKRLEQLFQELAQKEGSSQTLG